MSCRCKRLEKARTDGNGGVERGGVQGVREYRGRNDWIPGSNAGRQGERSQACLTFGVGGGGRQA